MTTEIKKSNGKTIMILSSPFNDTREYSGKTHYYIDVVEGERKGEGAEIEADKVYEALLNLLDKEI